MTEEQLIKIINWLNANYNRPLNFFEKDAMYQALNQAYTVGDLVRFLENVIGNT
ncbi:MAG: hypothetical protein J5685_11080 [Clostridiales bacterium]|nr:hypothetical protein [Clostridiales bacterium]